MDMTPHFPIYLDYGATTPVDPRVADAMIPWLREHADIVGVEDHHAYVLGQAQQAQGRAHPRSSIQRSTSGICAAIME